MRPSDILSVSDPVAAYCLDRAIFLFGRTMQADLDAAGAGSKNAAIANGKRAQVMARWLGTEVRYKSPGVRKAASGPAAVDSTAARGPVKL